jgi:hypothetical protein
MWAPADQKETEGNEQRLDGKHACRHNLWTHYPTEQLHARYGLYELPTTPKWKAAR